MVRIRFNAYIRTIVDLTGDKANRNLLSVFTFCNLFSAMTHLRQGKKVSILVPGDVNSSPVASRRGLLEAVLIMR
jgi:hypothetical protein